MWDDYSELQCPRWIWVKVEKIKNFYQLEISENSGTYDAVQVNFVLHMSSPTYVATITPMSLMLLDARRVWPEGREYGSSTFPPIGWKPVDLTECIHGQPFLDDLLGPGTILMFMFLVMPVMSLMYLMKWSRPNNGLCGATLLNMARLDCIISITMYYVLPVRKKLIYRNIQWHKS